MSVQIEALIDNLRKKNLGGDESAIVDALLRVLDRRPDLRREMDTRDLAYLKGMARGRYQSQWEEDKHPRAKGGQFGEKPGGGSSTVSPDTVESKDGKPVTVGPPTVSHDDTHAESIVKDANAPGGL